MTRGNPPSIVVSKPIGDPYSADLLSRMESNLTLTLSLIAQCGKMFRCIIQVILATSCPYVLTRHCKDWYVFEEGNCILCF